MPREGLLCLRLCDLFAGRFSDFPINRAGWWGKERMTPNLKVVLRVRSPGWPAGLLETPPPTQLLPP